MKFSCVLISIILIFTSGCASTVFYNIPEGTKYSEKSVLFLETKGHPLGETRSLTLVSINGKEPEDRLSTSRIEFKPGAYELEFKIKGAAGVATSFALGVTGGQAAMNTYMHGTNRNKDTNNKNKTLFRPGYYYFASFDINEKNEVIVSIEEI